MAILTVEAVAPKIREMNGNLAAVARHFGVNRSTVHRFVKDRPTLQEVCAECRETFKDHAESSLYRAVLAGEAWAVCFYLKTQGKGRGYTEQHNLEITLRRLAGQMRELSDDDLVGLVESAVGDPGEAGESGD